MKGNHFDDVCPNVGDYLDRFGGEEQLQNIRALMNELEPTMVHCPFCGEAAVLRGTFTYTAPAVLAECPRCHIGTAPLGEGFDYLTGARKTLEQCVRDAVTRWNRRREVA